MALTHSNILTPSHQPLNEIVYCTIHSSYVHIHNSKGSSLPCHTARTPCPENHSFIIQHEYL